MTGHCCNKASGNEFFVCRKAAFSWVSIRWDVRAYGPPPKPPPASKNGASAPSLTHSIAAEVWLIEGGMERED